MTEPMSIKWLLESMLVIAASIYLGIAAVAYHILPNNFMPYVLGSSLLLLANLVCLVWAVRLGPTLWQTKISSWEDGIEDNVLGPLLFAGAIVLAILLELFAKKEWRGKGVVAGNSR